MRGNNKSVLCGGAVVGLVAAAANAQFTFIPADYATPIEPKGLAVADFDGNGSVDLATTAEDEVNLLMNAGDGTFGSAVGYATGGSGAGHLIAAKLDADSDFDVAVVLTDSNQVRVMKNQGLGTFVQGALLNVGAGPTWMIGFDADGDSDVDLAAVNTGAGSITILFNNGDGGFPNGSTFPTGKDPRSVVASDFDGDGDLDLAVTSHEARTVATFLNDGKGVFTFGQAIIVGGQAAPEAIASGDFDGDGDADLAATTSLEGGPNLMAVFLNNSGTFAAPVHYPIGAADPGAVIASDFNGDDKLDLATVARGKDAVSLLAGNGDATFGAAQLIEVGDNPRRLRAADFNQDGKMDLATSNRDSNNITVLTNDGSQGGCLADLDGNGVLDLFDFLQFQNLFNAGDLKADCEMNGKLDLFDFLCFQNLFVQGCR